MTANAKTDIPCDECLVLSVCKNRGNIQCGLLYTWAIENQGRWEEMIEYLPNFMNITISNDPVVEGSVRKIRGFINSSPLVTKKLDH